MKKIYLLVVCICVAISQFGQNEYSKWYFGEQSGLNFLTSPPTVLTSSNSGIFAQGGCSGICDAIGNLLFYTSGTTVYNKQHAVMLNGNLPFTGSPNQGFPLVIKQPGNSNIYFMFRTFPSPIITTFPVPATSTGFYYATVDMTLAGGMGAVTAGNVPIYTTINDYCNTAQLHATKHANGTDYWIMIHEFPGNKFRAYLLTASGISPAVISSVGMMYQQQIGGCLKFSPNGQKLCTSTNYTGVELFDFNNATGQVSNPLTLISDTLETNFLGCEFSPDGSKLYEGHNFAGSSSSKLIQWNLNAGSGQAILSSSVNITTGTLNPRALQLALNGKIYIASPGSQSLSVINNPNAASPACNFISGGQPSSVVTNSGSFYYLPSQLPNMLTNATNSPCVVQPVINSQTICAGNAYSYGNKTYTAAGSYIDTVINVFSCNGISLVNTQLTVKPLPTINVTAPASVCLNQGLTITASGVNSYTWNNTTTGNPYTSPLFTSPGNITYSLALQGRFNSGCVATNTLVLSVLVEACDVGISSNELKWFSENTGIFPNPTSGDLTVSFSAALPFVTGGYTITNNLGQCVLKNELKNNSVHIPASLLTPGVYHIHFSVPAGVFTKKFIRADK